MEIDEDISSIESIGVEDAECSFGDISRISGDNSIQSQNNSNQTSISTSADEITFDPTAFIEISDILGLVGKNWMIFRVSPLWNLKFDKNYLASLSKHFTLSIKKNIATNIKSQKHDSNLQISGTLEVKEAYQECIALKIQVINTENDTLMYDGVLLKTPDYTTKKDKSNLLDMPVLLVQGSKPILTAVHNWLAESFDCVVRPYEFASYEFLWLIAISMGDAGQSYNETVLYHYLYNYEFSKCHTDIKFCIESEFLRSTLTKLSINRSNTEATSFHYSDLIKVQSEIEDHFKLSSGINASKLRLKAFEAPKVATINVSGKILIRSSTLMDLILKYLMELEHRK
ncbi:centromere protein L-like [Adelges cooleyi]|uniref:centromere protein L-like n=1 Tax=Adelges cooleyi TaxID=133065 RepID=UPI00217FC735|nr:centromere protein L-like [Adelges cooleyi]XP_050440233.1 centromere protein L-like [Adelges cooleyi]XP_050440234.1 centromere protein L-like [Adelges cooleyi]